MRIEYEGGADGLDVLFEDEHLAIINKPAGLSVHPSKMTRGEPGYLLHFARQRFGKKCHLIHRLDRPTSGCIAIAFDADTTKQLSQQWMARSVEKTYWAVVRGYTDDEGFIDHPLDAPGKPEAQPAQTAYQTLARMEVPMAIGRYDSARFSLVQVQPHTGRYRQIRRHFKHIFHHVIGDTSHGDGRQNRGIRIAFAVHRMLLHAHSLRFEHPHTQETLHITAPLDAPFQKMVDAFSYGV